MTADLDPRLSGHPGDAPPPPAREVFTNSSLGHWLDTPAGTVAIHQARGDRSQAVNAMVEDSQAAERWRREQAQAMYDRDPSRYPSGVGEALARVGAPPGGAGVYLAGEAEDLARMSRRVPGGGWVVSPETTDTTTVVGQYVDQDGRVINDPSLTAPPWQRD